MRFDYKDQCGAKTGETFKAYHTRLAEAVSGAVAQSFCFRVQSLECCFRVLGCCGWGILERSGVQHLGAQGQDSPLNRQQCIDEQTKQSRSHVGLARPIPVFPKGG